MTNEHRPTREEAERIVRDRGLIWIDEDSDYWVDRIESDRMMAAAFPMVKAQRGGVTFQMPEVFAPPRPPWWRRWFKR